MAFLKQLSEKLEAQMIYDELKGKYETRFKVNGMEYAFHATTMAGDCNDNAQWMLEFENMTSHRIGIGDNDKKIAKAFGEAVGQWIKEKAPVNFYTYGSHFDSIKNIIAAVKKQAKGYTLVDDTADRKNEENGEVIEGNPVGKITWTKMLTGENTEVVDTEDREAIVSDKFKPDYELPKDIKPNKKFMSGTSNKGKLDKGDKAYDTKTESFSEFKAKKFEVIEEGKGMDALKGAARSALKKIRDKVKGVCKDFYGFSKEELVKWLEDNKEDFIQSMDVARHMMDKKQLTFEEEILQGNLLKENLLDLVAKKTPNVLKGSALILMIMGSGQHVFGKNDSGEEAFKKAKTSAEKIVSIVKEQGAKAGEKITQGAEEVGKEAKKGAEKAGKEIEKGAKEVGSELEKGAEKAGKEIKGKVQAGAEKAGEVIRKGAGEIGGVAKDKAEELKQGFKRFIQKKKEENKPKTIPTDSI